MFELKPLSREAIPAALEKAERYRLLNEPVLAESICLDILAVDPNHQEGVVMLLLALADQFSGGTPPDLGRLRELLPRVRDPYHRAYYAGIVAERRAKALVAQGGGRRGLVAYDLLRDAIGYYEQATALAPEGDDEAKLRFNTCVRIIERNPQVRPARHDPSAHMLE